MLIVKSKLKQLALHLAEQRFAGTAYAGKFTRVSKDLPEWAETLLRNALAERISNMPTVGKTIR